MSALKDVAKKLSSAPAGKDGLLKILKVRTTWLSCFYDGRGWHIFAAKRNLAP